MRLFTYLVFTRGNDQGRINQYFEIRNERNFQILLTVTKVEYHCNPVFTELDLKNKNGANNPIKNVLLQLQGGWSFQEVLTEVESLKLMSFSSANKWVKKEKVLK